MYDTARDEQVEDTPFSSLCPELFEKSRQSKQIVKESQSQTNNDLTDSHNSQPENEEILDSVNNDMKKIEPFVISSTFEQNDRVTFKGEGDIHENGDFEDYAKS